MIKKILVALDGSDHAERALNFALDIANQYAAEIQLLVVVPPLLLPVHSFSIVTSEALSDASKQLEESFRGVLLKAEKKAKKEKPNVTVSTRFEHGKPDERIVEVAKNGSFCIIVIGSRGLGHRDYALGSVSSNVADNSPCPVLICK